MGKLVHTSCACDLHLCICVSGLLSIIVFCVLHLSPCALSLQIGFTLNYCVLHRVLCVPLVHMLSVLLCEYHQVVCRCSLFSSRCGLVSWYPTQLCVSIYYSLYWLENLMARPLQIASVFLRFTPGLVFASPYMTLRGSSLYLQNPYRGRFYLYPHREPMGFCNTTGSPSTCMGFSLLFILTWTHLMFLFFVLF